MSDLRFLWEILRPVRRKPKHEPMPARFYELSFYNAARSRGIVHTPEYDARMAELQADFNAWSEQRWLS